MINVSLPLLPGNTPLNSALYLLAVAERSAVLIEGGKTFGLIRADQIIAALALLRDRDDWPDKELVLDFIKPADTLVAIPAAAMRAAPAVRTFDSDDLGPFFKALNSEMLVTQATASEAVITARGGAAIRRYSRKPRFCRCDHRTNPHVWRAGETHPVVCAHGLPVHCNYVHR